MSKTIKIRKKLKLKHKINNFLIVKTVKKQENNDKIVWSESLRGKINNSDLWLKSDCSIFLIISIQKLGC